MYLLGYLAVSVSVASLEDGLPELGEVGAVVVLYKGKEKQIVQK